jgi:hypothetical protein
MMPEKSTQAGLLSACFNLSLTKARTAGKSRQIPRQVLNLACGLSWRSRRNTTHLNKTFCYLFTQNGCLFEMIIRTCLS